MASRPSSAWHTRTMSGSPLTIAAIPSRMSGWSSTLNTRILLAVVITSFLPIENVDALPAEQSGVDRPRARAKQHQRGAQRAQENPGPRISRLRCGAPEADDHQHGAGDGRPQTREQGDTS